MRLHFSLFFLGSALALAEPPARFVLGAGLSKTVTVDKLVRASVGDKKVVRVRAVPPSTLILTGVRPGRTTVRAWDENGREEAYEIEVVAADILPSERNEEGRGVVRIALEFLEIDSLISESLGVRWPEAIQFSASGAFDAATAGLNTTATFSSARGFLHALLRQGWGRMLAKPELYVRLGEEAHFHSGGEFPVATAIATYGAFRNQVDWKPFGLTVRVRPRSVDRFHISSDIKVEISELNSATAMEGIPGLTKRNLETKMNSRDGETVVLSGLVRQASAVEKEGLPFFSAIPVLGSLFSSKKTTGDTNEILMAVTFSFTTRAGERDRITRFRRRFEAEEAP